MRWKSTTRSLAVEGGGLPLRGSLRGAWLLILLLPTFFLACAGKSGDETTSATPPTKPATRLSPMAEILAERIAAAESSERTFSPRRRVEVLRSIEKPADLRARLEIELDLADALLRDGATREAAGLIEQALAAGKGAEPLPTRLNERLQRLAGITFLRLGELENCIEGHSADACLLPLRDGGVHRHPSGAKRAFDIYLARLEQTPDDLESRWLINIAAMALGEYPQNPPARFLIPPEVFAGAATLPPFRDRAADAGVAVLGLSGGVVSEDLDGDNDIDLMVSAWGLHDPLRVFLNDQGNFVEKEQPQLAGITGGLNLIHADYDNDGDADVLVLRGAWMAENGRFPPSLLRNRGDAFFDDVTLEAGLLFLAPTQTATWADFDRDGFLDLYFGAETTAGTESLPARLLRNRGDGTFEDRSAGSGTAVVGFIKAVVAADFNNDLWPDLYVSRLGEPNLLLMNGGGGGFVFTDQTREAGVAEPLRSFPVLPFDFDQDGWLDLFVSGFDASYSAASVSGVAADYLGLPQEGERPRLYRNHGNGRFEEIGRQAGLERSILGMGANFGDFDNDGYPDLYLGTGAPDFQVLVPNLAFRNVEGYRFEEVTAAARLGHLQKGHGIAFADFDRDFDQDIYAVLGGAYSGDVYWNALFENPGQARHHALTLRLEGTKSNRSAIGARLRLELPGGRQIHATVSTGGSFGSSSLQQEIGLGEADRVDALEITWPSGFVQRFNGLRAESHYHLREGDGTARRLELPAFALGNAGKGEHQHPAGHGMPER